MKKISHQKKLIIISLILWVISLFMNGLYTNEKRLTLIGYEILGYSFAAFLLPPIGWAVYANFTYLIAALKLLSDKEAPLSPALTLILMSLTFSKRELSNRIFIDADIISYGYGMFLWMFALILLIAAAWDKRKSRSFITYSLPYFTLFFIVASGLFYNKYQQWQMANIDERTRYLPAGAAIGLFQPSGIEYHPLPKQLPNNNGLVEIETNLNYKLSYNYISIENKHFSFDLPETFLYNGYQITPSSKVFAIPNKTQANYRYRIYLAPSHSNEKPRAVVSIYDAVNQKEIWHNDVILTSSGSRYPRFDNEIQALFKFKEPELPDKMILPAQAQFTSTCPVQPLPTVLAPLIQNDSQYFINLDNKISRLYKSETEYLFCNDDIILLLNIDSRQFEFSARIIQRNNYNHWVKFHLPNQSEDSNKMLSELFNLYKNRHEKMIHSIDLNGKELLLKHELGSTLLIINEE